MNTLKKIFHPDKKAIWRQLSDNINGEVVKGKSWQGIKIVARVNEWTVTLDTYITVVGNLPVTFTRFRAPYINKDGFRFLIYREDLAGKIQKLMGMQDIQVDYPEFDRSFIIQGNNEAKILQLFSNSKIRGLLQSQRFPQMWVRETKRELYPEGVDQLCLQVPQLIRDLENLQALYELFSETLNHLCHIGSAYENDPDIKLSDFSSCYQNPGYRKES